MKPCIRRPNTGLPGDCQRTLGCWQFIAGEIFVQFDKLGMKIVQFDDVCRNALDPKLAKSRQSMSAREKPVAAIPLGNRDRMLQANGLNRVP
jgi:hypothetical protein